MKKFLRLVLFAAFTLFDLISCSLENQSLINKTENSGSISGKIFDAVNGSAVRNAQINIRLGTETSLGSIRASAVSTSYGIYNISGLNAGNYTAEVIKAGYIIAYFPVKCEAGKEILNQNGVLSPDLENNQVRAVLNWGEIPLDLDLHVTGPCGGTDTNRFHVYFGEKSYSNNSVDIELEKDCNSGYGPETVMISRNSGGIYRFSVHDYTDKNSTNSAMLAYSGARVVLYIGLNQYTYNVPQGAGNLWVVFELNGQTVQAIDTMTNEADYNNIK